MSHWGIFISSVAGALVTLAGVAAGAYLADRSQRKQWSLDKQIDACAAIIAESTRVQIHLARDHRRPTSGASFDWAPWNVALGAIWMVGSAEVIAAAARIDHVFWNGHSGNEAAVWEEWRDSMEKARLDFINVARRRVGGALDRQSQIPVSRPSSLVALQQPAP